MSVFVYLIITELWPLIDVSILFHSISLNRVNGRNLTKFCICIDIDRIYIRIVTSHFLQICIRVMALD